MNLKAVVKDLPERTYSLASSCFNCGYQDMHKVPFGVLVAEWLSDKPCSKCGCTKQQVEEYFKKTGSLSSPPI
jgi:predicted nucleic-acid-binding Zn-ribbon protein